MKTSEEANVRKKAYMKKYNSENKSKIADMKKAWRARNLSRLKSEAAARYVANREVVLAKCKIHRKNNLERIRQYDRERYVKNLKSKLVSGARSRSLAKGMDFDVSAVDLHWPEKCPALGIPLDYDSVGRKGRPDGSPSLDRIDSSKGYTLGNTHVISWKANRIKQDSTPEELRKLADYMEIFHS